MMHSINNCVTVVELNAARRDLVNQVFKRGITPEEFDVAYEYLYMHTLSLGLAYHPEFRSYGPRNVDPIIKLLKNCRYAKFLKQFQQGADYINFEFKERRLSQAQYEMLWTVLLSAADFQGYSWNKHQLRFYED